MIDGTEVAGQRLYQKAIEQQKKLEEARQRASAHKPAMVLTSKQTTSPGMRNEGCERLYALSTSKQMQGKQRREEIMKSRLPPPPTEFKVMPLSQATKMYERSMKHLITKDMKLMDAAHQNETAFESLLIPKPPPTE